MQYGMGNGDDNESDMMTKVMSVRGNTTCARKMLGHCLVQGKSLRGVIECDTVEIMVIDHITHE